MPMPMNPQDENEPVDNAQEDAAEPQAGSAGPQPTKDIGFNQQIQNVLFSRIQTLSPQEVDAVGQIVTPDTYPILCKIFVELKPLFDQAMQAQQPGGQGGAQPQGPSAPQGSPLTNDNVSRGLVGGAGG